MNDENLYLGKVICVPFHVFAFHFVSCVSLSST